MTTNKSYKFYPDRPTRLTASFAKKEFDKLVSRLDSAESNTKPDEWIHLFASWDALAGYISGEACRTGYAYSKNMSDKKLEAKERYFRERIAPAIDKQEHLLVQSFVNSKHRETVATKFGQQLIPVYETALKPLDPINTTLGIKVGNLASKYDQLISSAQIEVDGKVINLSQARALLYSDDSKIREKAYRANGEWFVKNKAKLSQIYDAQVKLRHEMGKNLGYDSFIPLAYQMRGRQGYGEAEVEQFRHLVHKHLVPLFSIIAHQRTKELGQNTLKPWDIFYDPANSIPLGSVPVEDQLDKAQLVFDRLSPVLGKHFQRMRREGLIDLETRPNKQAGAYCTNFQDEDKVAILCNSTGDPDDIRVLVHEMGHAFQFWESQWIPANDLQIGTAELAEVYSMGMEFLSLPYMDSFFSAGDAKKFSSSKWSESIFTLCYVSTVDEFQHWVYKNPAATKKDREAAWIDTYTKYFPSIDFSGLEKYQGLRWYAQGHIFSTPFYYIDYALAETCAMQLGLLAQKDHSRTVTKYLEMCKLGGTRSFVDTLAHTNLRSPFDEKLIVDLKNYTQKTLEL